MSHKKLQVANQNWFLWTSNDFEVYMYGHQRLSTVLSSQKCTTHASTKWFEVDIWGLEWSRHKKFSSPKPKFALRVCINCKMPTKIHMKCTKKKPCQIISQDLDGVSKECPIRVWGSVAIKGSASISLRATSPLVKHRLHCFKTRYLKNCKITKLVMKRA